MEQPNYHKRDYVKTLEIITPKTYLYEDTLVSGIHIDPVDAIINSHLVVAENFSSIIYVSATDGISSINELSSVARYFIKQNNLFKITPFDFESKIMARARDSLKNYPTLNSFSSFIYNTFVPGLQLNTPTLSMSFPGKKAQHEYLVNNLSWLYFLNFAAPTSSMYSPSSHVADLIVNKIYNGETLEMKDAMEGLTKYLWYNYGTCSLFSNLGVVPSKYLSGTGPYTSGTQQLDKLLTMVDIVHSPLQSDKDDTRVRDAFNDFITLNVLLKETKSAGPLQKFLDAVSYSIYDINDQVEGLNLLYNIEKCPAEYLKYIADLIGWELLGHNEDKWRSQLRNAVSIYKAKGTKKALQLVMNSLFGEDSFDLSGSVDELYESYIPNLLYYSLATEAGVLSSFETWTPALAESLGIPDYSYYDMDTNIRYIVDDIIKDATELFPDNFFVGNRQFPLGDPKFVFYYRNRISGIPPWESEKYYRYCRVDDKLIKYLGDRLACLGVSITFVNSFEAYLRNNITENTSDLASKNRWLFFTPTLNYPPNKVSILSNYQKQKIKYLPIWNSKSSHFNLSFTASSFSFNKYSYLPNTSQGLKSIFKVVNDFSPAHAIPLIDLSISESDEIGYNERVCGRVLVDLDDFANASSILVGYGYYGRETSSLNRRFMRGSVSSLTADMFNASSFHNTNVNRTSTRRRNQAFTLPKDGWFDRTGFNYPSYLAPSSFTNFDSDKILGYIPSTGKFTSVSSVHSLPGVYVYCENFNSSSVFNGVATSSTFPVRGITFTVSSCNPYAFRDECHEIIPLIHTKLQERSLARVVSALEVPSYASAFDASTYYNIPLSLANTSTVPNSQNEFFNFEYGRGLHQAYADYCRYLGGHDIGPNILDASGGKNIISHAYGPLVYNGMLNYTGSAADTYTSLIASSFSDVTLIDYSTVLNSSSQASGTYVASSTSSLYLNTYEYRNNQILSSIEFIQTSGDSLNNYFAVYDIDSVFEKEANENFAINNPLIRYVNNSDYGLPRIKFDLRDNGNFFIPDHQFKLNARSFVGKTDGNIVGGGSIGIWIHTKPEGNYVWTFTKNGKWVPSHVSNLSIAEVKNNLAHMFIFPEVGITPNDFSSIDFPCLAEKEVYGSVPLIGMENLTSSLFKDCIIDFNTYNYNICMPNYYDRQVHTSSQSYVIEIFGYPDPQERTYNILDYLSIVDVTENNRVKEYTPKELLTVFRYFVDIAENRASRVASITSGTFEASGGSRLDYRLHPGWERLTIGVGNQITVMDFRD